MNKLIYQFILLAQCGVHLTMDQAPNGTNPLQMTLIGHFRLVQLAFQEQNITITITKKRLPEEDNWSGHSDLDRIL